MNHQEVKLNERYVIEKELGRGGLGIVYLARDIRLDSRPVVVKTMLGSEGVTFDDPWFREKFEKEIAALVRVRHPGVVGVLDVGQMPDGKPFFVMPYVEGENLRSAMSGGRMELERAALIIRQVGAALSAAHEKGVTHRDLKPENVMLQIFGSGEEFAVLIDFGIATVKDLQAAQSEHKTRVAGTLPYMSPEQLRGEPIPASDIWALGVLAYEMLTGHLPFPAHNVLMLADMQRAGVSTMPKTLRPELPTAVQEVLLKALNYDPAARYQHAHEMAEVFQRAILATEEATLRMDEIPPAAPQQPNDSPETGHVLFMDLAGYSELPMDAQLDLVRQMFEIVRRTPEFQRAQASDQLICLPTGDGMALVFFHHPAAPVQCALEIAAALKTHPDINLRMGLHSGPVLRMHDINENLNVTGGGINLAQRVMDSGDAGHILLSRSVADTLIQIGHWQQHLQDLGTHQVKHGLLLHLFSLRKGELGSPSWPSKLSRQDARPAQSPGELLQTCRELFESLDEFRSPESLRTVFRTTRLRIYSRCVPHSSRLDFDQLLDCLYRAGKEYQGQALLDLLDVLASLYSNDYRRQECESLRDSLGQLLGRATVAGT